MSRDRQRQPLNSRVIGSIPDSNSSMTAETIHSAILARPTMTRLVQPPIRDVCAKIDRKTHSYDGHYHAKLIDKPESFTSIACERSTDALNIKIVTRVSDSCYPETS